MSLTAQAGAAIIKEAVATAAAQEKAERVTAQAVGDDFCGIWPKAKPLLELAATFLVFIPGAGPIAGPVLNGLIKIGDQIYSETCRG